MAPVQLPPAPQDAIDDYDFPMTSDSGSDDEETMVINIAAENDEAGPSGARVYREVEYKDDDGVLQNEAATIVDRYVFAGCFVVMMYTTGDCSVDFPHLPCNITTTSTTGTAHCILISCFAMLRRAKTVPVEEMHWNYGRKMSLEASSTFPPVPRHFYKKLLHLILTAPPRSGKSSELILGMLHDVALGRNAVMISCSSDRTYCQLVDRVKKTLLELGLSKDVKVLNFDDLRNYNNTKKSKNQSKNAYQNAAMVEKMMDDHWITILRLDQSHLAALNKANASSSRCLAVWADELQNKVCLWVVEMLHG
jgi:hypothetical protein